MPIKYVPKPPAAGAAAARGGGKGILATIGGGIAAFFAFLFGKGKTRE
jgi:hypothetical protein